MVTRTEIHELEVQKAVERALSQIDGATILQAARNGSGFAESLNSGTYNSSDEYVQYEVSGDVAGLYPVGP